MSDKPMERYRGVIEPHPGRRQGYTIWYRWQTWGFAGTEEEAREILAVAKEKEARRVRYERERDRKLEAVG